MMKQKARVLVLAPDVPYPVNGGGRMRMVSIIPALASVADVAIACVVGAYSCREAEEWVAGFGCRLACHRRRRISRIGLQLQRLRTVLTWCNLPRYRDIQGFCQHQADEFSPDLIWLETPYLVRYAISLRPRLPVVIDYWGTSQGPYREYLQARGLGSLWQFVRWKTALRGEELYAPQSDCIVTVSEGDASFFRSIAPGIETRFVPSAVRQTSVPMSVPEEEGLMVLTGDMSYRPNVDAACRFVTQILPLIREQYADCRIRLVGGEPSEEIRAMAVDPAVEVTGFVKDMAAEISRASVYVLPMQLGSGIRSKLFDVFPLAKPIVTTSTGAEGLALVHGQNCLIADAPEDFADCCVRLLKDRAERRRLGAAVQRLASEVYTQENVERGVGEVLSSVLRGRE